MYRNNKGEQISRAKWREMVTAFRNRQELIRAGLMNRRDLVKLGLLTAAGTLVPKRGLSAWAQTSSGDWYGGGTASPPTTPWTLPLPIPPVKPSISATSLSPAPTVGPNTAINPATGLKYEGRTRVHQAPALGFPFPPPVAYQVTQRAAQVNMSNQLPLQTIWGFDGLAPGPTYVATYGTPILIRNVNSLPSNNGGFGINSVTTHLHNGHTPSESDGFPDDYFAAGQYYDQYYPNAYAGFNSDFKPGGNVAEALSSLWYHDHRAGFTSQNVYKGLAGFYLLFNQYDTGNETTGFRLPSFSSNPAQTYDIPLMLTDKVFDPTTGQLAFDSFNLDGILGDKFLVNGVIQPVLHVHPRRYRLRILNAGPSRFHQIYITDLNGLSASNPMWQISNDGNVLPKPVQVPAVALGVAERADVIVDFSTFAGKTIYLENRLEQRNGRGPDGNVTPAGQGDLLLQIIVDLPVVTDQSVDPATLPSYYALPSVSGTPRVKRQFEFDQRYNGQWTINDKVYDGTSRFTVQQNSLEEWELKGGRDWAHPIHIHFEEFQIVNGAPGLYGGSTDGSNYSRWSSQYCWSGCSSGSTGVNLARKDVVRLNENGDVTVRMRFRDWLGRYVMHCHNIIHEDHAMMLRFDIAPTGDTKYQP
jgi:FtsP/CotA-like multicopper oxidase with cupredoxin domain